jgi:LacI family transcriptional regulator/LacI family repressor for deo operon, udp, cdd, tsx, nupC, and nupG
MTVTIKDVAKRAGVSVATVSRMLNNSAAVSPRTAETIQTAIDELKYAPNFLGRNLRRSETNIILAVLPGVEHSFYNGIMTGMQDAAIKSGYDLLIGCSAGSIDTEKRLLSMLRNKVVDAAVLLGTKLSAADLNLYNEHYNIALACERIRGADVLTVTVDDEAAAFAATELIIGKGHKNIGLITAAGSALSAIDRREGFEKALRRHGLIFREENVFMSSYKYEDGVKAYHYFSKLIDPPTAIFCVSDLLAAAVIKSFSAEAKSGTGKSARFFSVVGFDNIQMASMLTPGLTTVGQPSYDIGKTVVTELINKKNEPNGVKKHIKLPFSIIERESLKIKN